MRTAVRIALAIAVPLLTGCPSAPINEDKKVTGTPSFSAVRKIDERVTFPLQKVVLEGGLPVATYTAHKPASAPLEITKKSRPEQQVWMTKNHAWTLVETALVLTHPSGQVPGIVNYNSADFEVTVGNAVDGELIARGLKPVDRSLLAEAELEMWLNEFSIWTSVDTPDASQLPRFGLGWRPLIINPDADENWVSVLGGAYSTRAADLRAGFLEGPQIILELTEPVFETLDFGLPVVLSDGRVEQWTTSLPRRVEDQTLVALNTTVSGSFGGAVEDFHPCFMDPNSGAFWGLNGLFQEARFSIDEYMDWKYGHQMDTSSFCAECRARLTGSSELDLPEGIRRSYEALQALIDAGYNQNEAISFEVIQDLISELEEGLRPPTPWQEVNADIPTVPPVWQCSACQVLHHVEFLVGFRPPGARAGGPLGAGMWSTRATWAVGAPKDGVYRVLTPSRDALTKGYTTHDGAMTVSGVLEGLIQTSAEEVAVVRNGQAVLVPKGAVEFLENEAACWVPSIRADGSQAFERLEANPPAQSSVQTFSERRVSLGCRIVETESLAVLGVANLQVSFREELDKSVQIRVVDGRVVSEDWVSLDDQDSVLILAVARRLVGFLPLAP